MVALSVCPGRREVVVWESYWRRGRSGNAIGLTKVARQSAMRAQHGPYHTEEHFSDICWPHGDLVDYLGRHGRSMVAVLCDGGLKAVRISLPSWAILWLSNWRIWGRGNWACKELWMNFNLLKRSSSLYNMIFYVNYDAIFRMSPKNVHRIFFFNYWNPFWCHFSQRRCTKSLC